MRYPPALAWSLLLASPAFARLHRHLSQHQTTNHHRRLHPRSFAPLLVQPEQSLEVHPRSQTVADLIDDPSIFERTLAAEAEELERRQLAAQEDWYGEASVPEQSIPAAQMLESPEQRQDTPIQDWEEDTHRYTFLASHPPPSDLDDPEHPVRPETIKNFAHHNAVGGDEDEDERVNQALEDGEDEEYDLNTIGEDEDYDLETIWDETDEYFLVEGDSEEGEFYRVKRSLDPRTSKGRKSSKKGRKQTKSKQKKLSQQQGMLGYSDKRAGPSGATSKTTKRSGPNGSQAWLNNGISKSKKTGRWVHPLYKLSLNLTDVHLQSPPKLKLSQLKTVSLTNALKSPSSPYHACKRFLPLFNESAKRHSLPPILLAALAMQESSCNPDTRGGGGEHGLMQLVSSLSERSG